MVLNNNYSANIGAIILAAGASSRLGTPKQLLKYAGKPLLQHTVDAATASGAQPVIVVLGANAEIVKKGIENNSVHVVINNEWNEGMASSIRYGVKTLLELNPSADGVIILLCDQPHVTPALLSNLMMTYQETGKLVVACYYGDTFGPPVFFHNSMFPELLKLNGDVGAKSLISQHTSKMELVPFPHGRIDIDTEADYQNLSNDNSES